MLTFDTLENYMREEGLNEQVRDLVGGLRASMANGSVSGVVWLCALTESLAMAIWGFSDNKEEGTDIAREALTNIIAILHRQKYRADKPN